MNEHSLYTRYQQASFFHAQAEITNLYQKLIILEQEKNAAQIRTQTLENELYKLNTKNEALESKINSLFFELQESKLTADELKTKINIIQKRHDQRKKNLNKTITLQQIKISSLENQLQHPQATLPISQTNNESKEDSNPKKRKRPLDKEFQLPQTLSILQTEYTKFTAIVKNPDDYKYELCIEISISEEIKITPKNIYQSVKNIIKKINNKNYLFSPISVSSLSNNQSVIYIIIYFSVNNTSRHFDNISSFIKYFENYFKKHSRYDNFSNLNLNVNPQTKTIKDSSSLLFEITNQNPLILDDSIDDEPEVEVTPTHNNYSLRMFNGLRHNPSSAFKLFKANPPSLVSSTSECS